MESPSCDPLRRAAREVVTVGLGYGVLGFQRLQVQRREWERSSGMTIPSLHDVASTMADVAHDLRSVLSEFGRR